jgi:hypothetical protein
MRSISSHNKSKKKNTGLQTLIVPIALFGLEILSLTVRKYRELRVFQNSLLRRIFRPKREIDCGEKNRFSICRLCQMVSRSLYHTLLNELFCRFIWDSTLYFSMTVSFLILSNPLYTIVLPFDTIYSGALTSLNKLEINKWLHNNTPPAVVGEYQVTCYFHLQAFCP